jgi:hypothetical protein
MITRSTTSCASLASGGGAVGRPLKSRTGSIPWLRMQAPPATGITIYLTNGRGRLGGSRADGSRAQTGYRRGAPACYRSTPTAASCARRVSNLCKVARAAHVSCICDNALYRILWLQCPRAGARGGGCGDKAKTIAASYLGEIARGNVGPPPASRGRSRPNNVPSIRAAIGIFTHLLVES